MICQTCGRTFEAKRQDARFCSPRCRKAASRRGVTDNLSVTPRVTDNGGGVTVVTDNFTDDEYEAAHADAALVDQLDDLASRWQRGRMSSAEAEEAVQVARHVLDRGAGDDSDGWIARAL